MRGNILHLLHDAVQYAHTADRTATAWKHLLVPDEELPALLAKAREDHTNLLEQRPWQGMMCTRMRCRTGACGHGM